MIKILVIPNNCKIDDGLRHIDFVKAIQQSIANSSKNRHEAIPYELTPSEFENEVKNGLGSDRWFKIIDVDSYCVELLQQVDEMLDKQLIGTAVNIDVTDRIGNIAKANDGYLYQVGKEFGKIKSLIELVPLLISFIEKYQIQLLDITLKVVSPDNLLFDIYGYADMLGLKMLDDYFVKNQKDGLLKVPCNKSGSPLSLALLSGLGFETLTIDTVSKEKDTFYLDGTTEYGDNVSVNYEDLPPKAVAYLLEHLYLCNY